MNTLKTILVDDEQDSLDVLKHLLNHFCPQVEIVARCSCADEAIEKIQILQPHLIFVDIEMPGKDGFEVFKAFKDRKFKVIITTGYEQYALKAIKYSAIDYLLKPIDPHDLIEAVDRIHNVHRLQGYDPRLDNFVENSEKGNSFIPDRIILPSQSGFKTILLEEIISIESSSGGYSIIHLAGRKQEIVTQSLTYFEDLLSCSSFYRVHRSCILNLTKIYSYNRSSGLLQLDAGVEITVAARRKAAFYKAYQALMA